MPDSFNMLTKQVREIWKQFGAPQRVSVILSMVVAAAVLCGLIYWGTRPDFRLLYGSLSLADAAQVREKLEDAKIPVQIGQSGTAISVPASDLYTARLMLASAGLPQDSSTGFELFEQPKFGLTDFAQKVNYQRALQGELERTIASMQGIRAARVMLVLPKEHLFASDEERKAQASVLITLNGTTTLGNAQVQSIVHLLASSVQNLEPGQVTVSDQTGNLLTQSRGSDGVLESSSEQLDVQARTEQRLVEKAQAILDRALGAGSSIVRVNVALDFSDREQRNQTYDAENRVALSERIVTEDKAAASGSGGKAGVMASVSVGDPSNMTVDSGGNKDKSEEMYTEYAVPSNVSTIREKGARVEKMTVAVCIAQGSEPRTPEQLKAISSLVASALGVDSARSDTIEIAEMPFAAPQQPADPKWYEQLPVSYDTLFKGAGGFMALCFVFGASRKVKKALLASNPSIDGPVNQAREQEQERVMKEEPFELEDHLAQVNELAKGNPKTVAAWIANAADWSVEGA